MKLHYFSSQHAVFEKLAFCLFARKYCGYLGHRYWTSIFVRDISYNKQENKIIE